MTATGATFGLNREATVLRYNSDGTMDVGINLAKSDSSIPPEVTIPIPTAWSGPNGEFSGGFPEVGSSIWIGYSQGGRWVPLGYSPSDNVFKNISTTSLSGFSRDIMSAFKPGRHLTQVRNNIKIITDPDVGIQMGDPCNYSQFDPIRSITLDTFKQKFSFTDAHRSVKGPIKRDLNSNITRNIAGSALSSVFYDKSLTTIGLDPLTKPGNSFYRNPPFSEERSVTYEKIF